MSIQLPAHFDLSAFESLLRELSGDWTREVDAGRVRTATPAGTVALLVLGNRHSGLPHGWLRHQLTPAGAILPPFHLLSEEHLDQLLYVLRSDAVRQPLAWAGYPDAEAEMLLDCVADAARNVFEHAGGPGWLAMWTGAGGELEVAIGDSGWGFRNSLDRRHAYQWGDGWSDAAALEAAFLQGTSRHADPSRGRGLQTLRARARDWNGCVAIRSGTARIAELDGVAAPVEADLPALGGSLTLLTLPSRI